MAKILLEMRNITKTFPGVKALDNVNFHVFFTAVNNRHVLQYGIKNIPLFFLCPSHRFHSDNSPNV